jgi:arabinose-5-phosphate isomerase
MHADAIHGDLGMVQEQDIVMIISKSGESEISPLPLVPFGNTLIGMVGSDQSFAKQSDIFKYNSFTEACPNNLAPTSKAPPPHKWSW